MVTRRIETGIESYGERIRVVVQGGLLLVDGSLESFAERDLASLRAAVAAANEGERERYENETAADRQRQEADKALRDRIVSLRNGLGFG